MKITQGATENPLLEHETFIDQDDVISLIPGMTRGNLAQLRFTGKGPKFYKPTPRTVLYKKSEVLAWVESTATTTTASVRL